MNEAEKKERKKNEGSGQLGFSILGLGGLFMGITSKTMCVL